MARKIAELPGRGRNNYLYPWDEWADGDPWLIIRDEDYKVSDSNFKSAAAHQATVRGLKISVRTHPEGVAIQFTKPEPVRKPRGARAPKSS